jgi:hypothetical protein
MDTPGLAEENRTKPEECARISAGIKAKRPEDVARAVVHAIDHRRFSITADPRTAVLARAGGALEPLLHRSFDRTVAKVRRARR